MWLNYSGLATAQQSLCLYFMWLEYVHILESKMYFKACFLKNTKVITRMHFANRQLLQRLLKSAIVFMLFFFFFKSLKSSSYSTSWSLVIVQMQGLFFQIKDMIALPQFLGMFLVQFFIFFIVSAFYKSISTAYTFTTFQLASDLNSELEVDFLNFSCAFSPLSSSSESPLFLQTIQLQ